MIFRSAGSTTNTGPIGPVAVLAAAVLLCLAPLMRGGNRQIALIALEAISVLFLLSIWRRSVNSEGLIALVAREPWHRKLLLLLLVASPAWLALVYLVPLPGALWSALPGRSSYGPLMAAAGIPIAASLPLSLVPDATRASLLAGIPLVAAFIAGYASRPSQLKFLLGVVAGMAFLQVLLGLFQTAGGNQSSLYFSVEFGGRPIGTFANRNHYANYIGMALAAYIWLGWSSVAARGPGCRDSPAVRFGERHVLAFWIAGGMVLALGILMTWSRGAALSVLPAAALAGGLALLAGRPVKSLRIAVLVVAGVLISAIVLAGVGSLAASFDFNRLAIAASFRSLLASSTLLGAGEFWPLGSGWGTYASVYPRFQPVAIDGYAEHAHQDYAQMLFEGGVSAVAVAAAFIWLAAGRIALLARLAVGKASEVTAEHMACAVCGLGLLGFLVHSLVEFNMHIPANAILAALLAGIFLRPLRVVDTAK